MTRALIAALCLLPGVAMAASTTLSWTNLTTYNDGSPLAAADIVSHRVQYTGSCPGFAFVAVANNFVVAGNATSLVIDNITAGTRCFRVFVTVNDPRCNLLNGCLVESLASAPWSKTFTDDPPPPVPPRTPMAPTGLSGN